MLNIHLWTLNIYGWAGRITSGFLPSALRASLRLFKIAPGDFVEPLYGSHPSCSIFKIWLGREDSNLRMPGSKPGALPLGDGPINFHSRPITQVHRLIVIQLRLQGRSIYTSGNKIFPRLGHISRISQTITNPFRFGFGLKGGKYRCARATHSRLGITTE